MGGLRRRMPTTYWTFMVGTIALAGIWPLSGFFSKDAILAQALTQKQYLLFGLGALVAALTAFYMTRLVIVVFFGPDRSHGHARETALVVTWPLRILALFSVIGGVIGIEHLYETQFGSGAEDAAGFVTQLLYPFLHAWKAAVTGLLAAGLGILGAYTLYGGAQTDPLPARLGGFARAMRDRFYWDELYEATVIRLHDFIAAVAGFIDRWIIAGLLVRGTHGTTELVGRAVRLFQTGNLQTYAFLFALGVAIVLYLALK
jgi:NADH-quinone oxidoreductase subunit L